MRHVDKIKSKAFASYLKTLQLSLYRSQKYGTDSISYISIETYTIKSKALKTMSTTEWYLNTLNNDKKISLQEYLISSKIKSKG